nr:MAG TPA: hypothetical protein [Bacteriophage sp.]
MKLKSSFYDKLFQPLRSISIDILFVIFIMKFLILGY